jgi:CHAD domain-containing protein
VRLALKERYFVAYDFSPEKIEEFTSGELSLFKRETIKEKGTLLDSFDWLLWKSGNALVASGSVLSLYGETVLTENSHASDIKNIKDLSDGLIKQSINGVIGQRVFLKKAESSSSHSLYDVTNEDGKTVSRFEVVEIELFNEKFQYKSSFLRIIPLKGYERESSLVQASLEDAGGSRLKIPPFCYVIKKSGLEPTSYKTKVTAVGSADSLFENEIKDICKRLLNIMEQNESGIKEGVDIEFLHDYRVALRRLRSCLALLKGMVVPEDLDNVRSILSGLFNTTGSLRDTDVYLRHMDEYKESLPDELSDGLKSLTKFLRKEQLKESRKLTKLFGSVGYDETKNIIKQFLNQEAVEEGAKPVKALALKTVKKAYKKVTKKAAQLSDDCESMEIHRIRILCKKLRYTLEFFEKYLPEKERETAEKTLKTLQDSLGQYHDFEIQRTKLLAYSEFSVKGLEVPLKQSLAVGYLVRILDEKQKAQRLRSLKLIADFTSAKMRKTFKDMVRK